MYSGSTCVFVINEKVWSNLSQCLTLGCHPLDVLVTGAAPLGAGPQLGRGRGLSLGHWLEGREGRDG